METEIRDTKRTTEEGCRSDTTVQGRDENLNKAVGQLVHGNKLKTKKKNSKE